mmetsp:Transcript_36059/g.87616  ORF Transcript_36059/g.87616 Transcript_36059/m.87616 type:complete len:226 (+) Transcript_36059:507-1184(+)
MLWVHVTQLHVCTLPGKCLRSSDLSLLTDSASNHVRCHVPSCKTCCRHQKVPIRSTADMGATFSSKSCGKEERPLSRITSSLLERVVIPSLAALRDDRGLCATGELCELRDGERDVGNRLDDCAHATVVSSRPELMCATRRISTFTHEFAVCSPSNAWSVKSSVGAAYFSRYMRTVAPATPVPERRKTKRDPSSKMKRMPWFLETVLSIESSYANMSALAIFIPP